MKKKKREEGPQFRIVVFEHFYFVGSKSGQKQKVHIVAGFLMREKREERREKEEEDENGQHQLSEEH